jgi:hypothetical protein
MQAWGRNPSTTEIGEHGPAQASGEHGQDKLQVSLANVSSRWAWPEQSKLQEGMEQTPRGEQTLGGYREEQRGVVEEKHLLDTQEIPLWHGEAVPARPRRHHLTRQAPDLAEDRAKQLEIKLEVAMAKNQSFGGEGDESVRGAIDKISRIGRIVVA